MSLNKWVGATLLGLASRNAEEWDIFTIALKQGNVYLLDSLDKLVWLYNSRDGKVTANLAYKSTISVEIPFEIDWWMEWLWKGTLLLKIKLFSWLSLKNKILTWEGLERRGVVGPGRCSLFSSNLESVAHLFGD